MYKLLIVLMLLAVSPPSVWAQLNVSSVLNGKYRDNPNAQETILKGDVLHDYKLIYYDGLTLTDMPEAAKVIEPLVTRDGAQALHREVSYKGGSLYYAYYMLPRKCETNRFLFYLNRYPVGGNQIVLIYMEGDAGYDRIKKMLKK